jgi:hypothetical protein
MSGANAIRLIVDRAAASFPWEMACFRSRSGDAGVRWLGLELALTRPFRGVLSQRPGTMPPLNGQVRVLVIADPAPERVRNFSCPAVDALRRVRGRPELRIDVESRIGVGECDLVEILALILTGGFDIVHFAGHRDYDPADSTTAGWAFGRDQILTARGIFRARRVPRLVFANACFPGVIHAGASHSTEEQSRGLATITQRFSDRGVPNCIGSGWLVNDAQAGTFAIERYASVFPGTAVRESIRVARRKIYDEGLGSTWGAYQH